MRGQFPVFKFETSFYIFMFFFLSICVNSSFDLSKLVKNEFFVSLEHILSLLYMLYIYIYIYTHIYLVYI